MSFLFWTPNFSSCEFRIQRVTPGSAGILIPVLGDGPLRILCHLMALPRALEGPEASGYLSYGISALFNLYVDSFDVDALNVGSAQSRKYILSFGTGACVPLR